MSSPIDHLTRGGTFQSFPHHVHIEQRENAEESEEMALSAVLRIVESAMSKDS